MPDAPNLAPDAFRGTADAYARFRPPYPPALLDDLLAHLPARHRLLDLACGPGRICLALADRFDEIWAVDLEPEMIAVAQRRAAGARHFRWFTGRVETLDAPAGTFDLVTIGEAFHRLDQRPVAEQVFAWLKPGGLVATMGAAGFFQDALPWKRAILAVARRFFPEGWASAAPGATGNIAALEELLRETGFTNVATVDYVVPQLWTVESIIGYLRSTSVCSAHALHGQTGAFDAAVTEALLALERSGRFSEDLLFGCTTGRKPA